MGKGSARAETKGCIGCIVLLIIAGPLLLGFGLSLLLSGDDLDGNIAQYNAAIGYFTENRKPIVDATTATVTNSYTVGSLSLVVSGAIPVIVQGNTDGVQFPNWYNDSYFTISNLVPTFTQTFSLTYNGITGTPIVVAPPALTRTKTVSVRCSFRSGCSLATMQSKCESAAPSSCSNRAVVSGSCNARCSRNCTWTEDISDVCIVVRFANGMWIPDPEKTFCTYPFSFPQYGMCLNTTETDRPLTYRLRSNTDPFIVLQDLTRGTGTFAAKDTSRRSWGIALTVIGAIVLTGMLVVAALLLKSCLCPSGIPRSLAAAADPPFAPVVANDEPETAAPMTESKEYGAADHPFSTQVEGTQA